MNSNEIVLAALGLAAAGLVKGLTGIGYATCAMPLLALATGLQTAIALVVVPALASNAAVIATTGMIAPTLKRFGVFYAGILPGIAAGAHLLPLVDVEAATRGLAVLTLVYVLLALARPRLSMPARCERALALPAGMANGVLTGLTGSQIVPLVPYMLALNLEPRQQVQAINLAVTIASASLGVVLLAAGIMTPELLAFSCAGVAPAVLGTFAGDRLRGHVSVDRLKRLTLVMLMLMALGLVARDISVATRTVACGGAASTTPRSPIEGAESRAGEDITGCLARIALAAATRLAELADISDLVSSRGAP